MSDAPKPLSEQECEELLHAPPETIGTRSNLIRALTTIAALRAERDQARLAGVKAGIEAARDCARAEFSAEGIAERVDARLAELDAEDIARRVAP